MFTGDMLSRSANPTETEKWLLTEYFCNAIASARDQDQMVDHLINGFWPFLNPYYSPLNPIFTAAYQWLCKKGLSAQNDRQLPMWMMRDGIVPLVWHLGRFSPDSVNGQILVHQDFAPLVPNEWRKKTALYRFVSRQPNPPQALLVVAPVCERMLNLNELENQLQQIETHLGKSRMAKIQVHLYAPIRGEGEEFVALYFQKLYSYFKNVKVVDWFHMENAQRLNDFAYVELTRGWLIRDSFVRQHILSRGASLLLGTPPTKGRNVVPLSRFHGVEISKCTGAAMTVRADSASIFYAQAAKIVGDENSQAPWPKWHEKWCHAVFKDLPRTLD